MVRLKSERGQKGEIPTLIHKEVQEQVTPNVFYIKERTYRAGESRTAATETAAEAFSFQFEQKFDCAKNPHTNNIKTGNNTLADT